MLDAIAGGLKPGASNASKTHCKRGHRYDLLNTAWRHGDWRHGVFRECRECTRMRNRRRLGPRIYLLERTVEWQRRKNRGKEADDGEA